MKNIWVLVGLIAFSIVTVGDNYALDRKQVPATFFSMSVTNATTGQPITNGETLPVGSYSVQVTVATTGPDCVGQYEITGRVYGAGVFPVERLAGSPLIVGGYAGNSFTFPTVNVLDNQLNEPGDYKIIATCGAPAQGFFGVALFEFMVAPE